MKKDKTNPVPKKSMDDFMKAKYEDCKKALPRLKREHEFAINYMALYEAGLKETIVAEAAVTKKKKGGG